MSATEFNLPSPKRRRLTDGGDNRDADDRKQQQATSDSKKSSESSTDQQLYTTTLPVPPPPASLESLGAAILRRVANVSDSGVGGAAAAAGDSGSAPASQNDSDELADGSDHFNVPKFPIQRIESQQHKLERQLTLDTPAQAQPVLVDDIDSHTRSVQFQRVIISGDSDLASSAGVDEDVTESCSHLVWAMHVRQRYMRLAGQAFCATTARYLCRSTSGVNTAVATTTSSASTTLQVPQSSTSGADAPPSDHLLQPPPQPHHHHHHHHQPEYTLDSLPKDSLPINLSIESGVFRLTNCPATESQFNCLKIPYVDKDAFVTEHKILIALTSNGPLKSYCFRRLTCLQSKYQLHSLLNELTESAEQKLVPHRDFYNIRKVDNHIHASSAMNQKHLLKFIKRSLKKHPDEKVYVDRSGELLSLKQIFEAMKITDYDLNIDMLDVHADRHTFQRFDKFNSKYNPLGRNHLREVFLKTDNHIGGRFFAEILREVMNDLKESRYQNAELRLSIYGRSADEWDKLAQWALHHGLTEFNDNVRWMIQIPRLFDVYRRHGQLDNFQTFLDNLFRPLFEATIDPSSHPHLFVFMQSVVAFDSVDDESKSESVVFDHDSPEPAEWTESQRNPPYAYYLYYLYANLVPLNALRRERGLQPIVLRPHCGEAGPVHHLATAFLLADNISHGLLLRKAPVLQYLYYLAQVPMAMSPLSNNSLFLPYSRSPLPDFHAKGLCVTLSTDDPLMFHFTKEPLMEEYSIAAQVWKLTNTDMCELARNSVIMSGFPHEVKKRWLGPAYQHEGVLGNDIRYTNLPNVRVAFRFENLLHELALVTTANPRSRAHSGHSGLSVPAAMSTRTKSMSVLFEDEG
ncbi:hypothetical protein BOX15_Mlig006681g1 [Macrostomum lignano]|uniref:AMP deaminase 2 n=1 Tax=Macrostomum lignano TaxID=282301 RepID=A0A267GXA8_9PLAT|nr:hypothetical protein BOX15_Mlig006681g3 [Macrostomum lignano]PAA90673.1 hypothetical protein BOX15_Mlig006681g1 [Macrostomum lignano]